MISTSKNAIFLIISILMLPCFSSAHARSVNDQTESCRMPGFSDGLSASKARPASMDGQGLSCQMSFDLIAVNVGEPIDLNALDMVWSPKIDMSEVAKKPLHGIALTQGRYVTHAPHGNYLGPAKFAINFAGSADGQSDKSNTIFDILVEN